MVNALQLGSSLKKTPSPSSEQYCWGWECRLWRSSGLVRPLSVVKKTTFHTLQKSSTTHSTLKRPSTTYLSYLLSHCLLDSVNVNASTTELDRRNCPLNHTVSVKPQCVCCHNGSTLRAVQFPNSSTANILMLPAKCIQN